MNSFFTLWIKNKNTYLFSFAAVVSGVLGYHYFLSFRDEIEKKEGNISSRSDSRRSSRIISSFTLLGNADLSDLDDGENYHKMLNKPSDVMAYIDSMSDRELALKLAAYFASEFGGTHLKQITSWMSIQKDNQIKSTLLTILAPRWAREDPVESVEFAVELGSDEKAKDARKVLLKSLNSEGAISLLKRINVEEVAGLVRGLKDTDLDLAQVWISEIDGEELREAISEERESQ